VFSFLEAEMKRLCLGVVVAVALIMALASQIKAAPSRATLNWGSHINAASCDRSGPPLINVTGKVAGDVDSGQAGNYWAFDEFNRTIQMWKQADGKYCAVVRFSGKFDAQAGAMSPGATGPLTGEEDGTFEGGYWAIIDGTLFSAPVWKTRGNVGKLDYNCTLNGSCAGYVSWLDQYFSDVSSFDQPWWGWVYHGVRNSWVNSSDGNSGDVF
jgi:hypothetical protein